MLAFTSGDESDDDDVVDEDDDDSADGDGINEFLEEFELFCESLGFA